MGNPNSSSKRLETLNAFQRKSNTNLNAKLMPKATSSFSGGVSANIILLFQDQKITVTKLSQVPSNAVSNTTRR